MVFSIWRLELIDNASDKLSFEWFFIIVWVMCHFMPSQSCVLLKLTVRIDYTHEIASREV